MGSQKVPQRFHELRAKAPLPVLVIPICHLSTFWGKLTITDKPRAFIPYPMQTLSIAPSMATTVKPTVVTSANYQREFDPTWRSAAILSVCPITKIDLWAGWKYL